VGDPDESRARAWRATGIVLAIVAVVAWAMSVVFEIAFVKAIASVILILFVAALAAVVLGISPF